MHFHSSTEKDLMLLPSNYFSVIFKSPAGSESTLRDWQEMQLSLGHLSPLWIEALLHEILQLPPCLTSYVKTFMPLSTKELITE